MWIKLDDGFATHPKIIAAGPLALSIQIRALCYSGRYLTDGFLPEGILSSLFTGMERIGLEVAGVMEPDGRQLVGMGLDADEIDWCAYMVGHGLWETVPGGYLIHDYLDYNLSRKQAQELRKKLSMGGRKGMKARWNQSNKTITKVITQDITDNITHRTGLGRDKDKDVSSLSSPEEEGKNCSLGNASKMASAHDVLKTIQLKSKADLREMKALDAGNKWFPPIP